MGFMMWVLMFLHSLPCISSATGYDYHKFGNHDCCCFGYNLTPPPHTSLSWVTKRSASGVILVITLLNIIVYKLSQLQETRKPSSFPSQRLCHQFLLAEMRLATNNFDEALMIGKGGFGKVYRGVIGHGAGAMTVAIKRLDSRSKQGASEFWTEIKMLSNFRHTHLVSLIGYCDEFNEMIVVYEYVSGGNLGERLYKTTKPLSWVERLKICIGAARALDYLHTGTGIRHRVIHRDVKTSNILLDELMAAMDGSRIFLIEGFEQRLPWSLRMKILIGAARGVAYLHATENQIIYRDLKASNILLDKDLNAKLSDFGFARGGPINGDAHLSTLVFGTYGYAAPEYVATGHLSGKNDIYAFGVVLLETLTGLRVIDKTRPEKEQNLVEWARPILRHKRKLKTLIDPTLGDEYPPEAAFWCGALVVKCTQLEPKERPSIEQVLQSLEQINGMRA